MAGEKVTKLIEDPAMCQVQELPHSGTVISYSTVGEQEGSPVVYFPGMSGNRYNSLLWLDTLRALKIRLIVIDRPSRGKTTPVDLKDLNPLLFAECVLELLGCLGIAKAGVMGHSAGCLFAAALAMSAPERLEGRLVLLAPWNPPSSPAMGWTGTLLSMIPAGLVNCVGQMMAKQIGESTSGGLVDDWGQRLKRGMTEEERACVDSDEGREIMRQSMVIALKEGGEQAMLNDILFCLEKFRTSDVRYPDVQSPTVIYHGTKDTMVPLACATWMKENMPKCELVILPNGSHNFILDQSFMSGTVLPSLLVK